MADLIRKHVYYSGSVQGVGFRYTTVRLAANYRLTGYVRNTPDGRVELLAQGHPREIDAFLADIARALLGNIADTQILTEPPADEFDNFTVRY